MIFTCRDEDDAVARWLRSHGVQYDAINCNPDARTGSGKVFADVYLDDRALQPGSALRQIAGLMPEGDAKRKLLKAGRGEGAGAIMFAMPEAVAKEVAGMQQFIDPGSLTADGIEDWPHVTLLYGITGATIEEVVEQARTLHQFEIHFGRTSLFSSPERDVIKVDCEAPELQKWHARLEQSLPVEESPYEDYLPHMTLAYVTPGSHDVKNGLNQLTDKTARVTQAVVQMHGKRVRVPLRSKVASATQSAAQAVTFADTQGR